MDANITGRTRVALAVASRDTADLARGLVGDVSTPMVTGELIRKARRMQREAIAAKDRAVLVELSQGATWNEVADALGLPVADALRVYGDTWEAWKDGEWAESLDSGDQGVGLIGDTDLAGTAHSIDMWWRRHAEPWEGDATGPGPVVRALVDGQATPGDRQG